MKIECDFYSFDDLVDRLSTTEEFEKKPVVFIVGSPISAPTDNNVYGVPNVNGIITLIRNIFIGDSKSLADFDKTVSITRQSNYQEAFRFLLGRRGQDAVNRIIKNAVLKSYINNQRLNSTYDTCGDISDENCQILENCVEDWHLSPGTTALGHILTTYKKYFGNIILTTNFDPLIEISVKKNNGIFFKTVVDKDGNISQTTGEGIHVIHLHGYWHGYDTLHTPRQLTQGRQLLKSSLSSLISNCTICVVGYGGWDDIFTSALSDAVNDTRYKSSLLWAFYEKTTTKIYENYERVINILTPNTYSGRIQFFSGVNCHQLFPSLLQRLNDKTEFQKKIVISNTMPNESTVPIRQVLTSDNPPYVEVFVGRKYELKALSESNHPVTFITGIGGQGKSALASEYVKKHSSEFNHWDWKDCREEGDNLHTQILSIIDSFDDKDIRANELKNESFINILEVFFHILEKHNCLFIFDNVDHYIDLESLHPVQNLKLIIDFATTKKHESKFVFTCRPNITADSYKSITIRLHEGLSLIETTELFEKLKIKSITLDEISAIHTQTNGHPLWLNILAQQISHRYISPQNIIEGIPSGEGDLPEYTMRSVFNSLDKNRIYILKILASHPKPIPLSRLYEFAGRRIRSKVTRKIVNDLKSLNLLVSKQRENASELLELHPLIRTFMLKQFSKGEQEQYIVSIITYYDRMIVRFKPLLRKEPTLPILENWTQKVELNTIRGQYKTAMETLSECRESLLTSGYVEEYIRITKILFNKLDWSEAIQIYSMFDSIFSSFIEFSVNLGNKNEVDNFLELYKKSIPGKSPQYINYCDNKCYYHWFYREYDLAIHYGEEGVRLKSSTEADTSFDCSHHLALAQRDNGNPEEALTYFLKNYTLDAVLSEGEVRNADGPFYGNIGRCLYLMGKVDDALNCYKKSAILLEHGSYSNRIINQGYARFWIAEAMERNGEYGMAYLFYKSAIARWKKISPPNALISQNNLDKIMDHVAPETISLNDELIDIKTIRWIRHNRC